MNEDLTGLVAVITGGGSGIGAATARELARRGATVTVIDRTAPETDPRSPPTAATSPTAPPFPARSTASPATTGTSTTLAITPGGGAPGQSGTTNAARG